MHVTVVTACFNKKSVFEISAIVSHLKFLELLGQLSCLLVFVGTSSRPYPGPCLWRPQICEHQQTLTVPVHVGLLYVRGKVVMQVCREHTGGWCKIGSWIFLISVQHTKRCCIALTSSTINWMSHQIHTYMYMYEHVPYSCSKTACPFFLWFVTCNQNA